MRDFFDKIPRYSGFFIFILLEAICFILIVRYNSSQREIFLYSSSLFSGFMNKNYADATAYIGLTERVDSLKNENRALKKQIANFRERIVLAQTDSIPARFDSTALYDVIPAKIISNSVSLNHNYLTLDVGRKDKVEALNGVISANGVVGIVKNVSNHYARVMSLLHRQSRISAAIKKNGFFGTLVWRGDNPKIMILEDVPKHATVTVGDTIVTSGYSAIFPPGLMIGKVLNHKLAAGSNSHTITVELQEDLSRLKDVYVVKNLRKRELDSLLEESRDE